MSLLLAHTGAQCCYEIKFILYFSHVANSLALSLSMASHAGVYLMRADLIS